jgi:hypothetical protein
MRPDVDDHLTVEAECVIRERDREIPAGPELVGNRVGRAHARVRAKCVEMLDGTGELLAEHRFAKRKRPEDATLEDVVHAVALRQRARGLLQRRFQQPPHRAGQNSAVADDWRLTIELDDEARSRELVAWLSEVRLESGEREPLGERVIVSRDGPRVFLYTDAEERARHVEALVLAKLGHPAAGHVELSRWHPAEQRWEDPSVPLPRNEEEWRAEHERLQAREARESRAAGYAEWEVRVELPGHDETTEFAERLEREGVPVVRRYTYLLVGAVNQDQARELAQRLKDEAPEGATVEVEPGGQMVWEVAPNNPFAVFGGLGN